MQRQAEGLSAQPARNDAVHQQRRHPASWLSGMVLRWSRKIGMSILGLHYLPRIAGTHQILLVVGNVDVEHHARFG